VTDPRVLPTRKGEGEVTCNMIIGRLDPLVKRDMTIDCLDARDVTRTSSEVRESVAQSAGDLARLLAGEAVRT